MLWDSLRSIFMWGKQDYVKDWWCENVQRYNFFEKVAFILMVIIFFIDNLSKDLIQ